MGDAAFDNSQIQHTACPACGHDASAIPTGDLAPALVDVGRRWREFLGAVTDYPGGVDALGTRPDPAAWSALEYGCHVRDVLSLFARRVEVSLLAHRPAHAWWDHEQAAIDDYYLAQDPAAVADDLEHAAAELAALVQPLRPEAWDRPSTTDGVEFTVAGLVRAAWHEAVHHLDDARSVVPAPSA